jgi:hypothetical protein
MRPARRTGSTSKLNGAGLPLPDFTIPRLFVSAGHHMLRRETERQESENSFITIQRVEW